MSCCRPTRRSVLFLEPALGCNKVERRYVWDYAGSWQLRYAYTCFVVASILILEETPILGE